MFPFSSDQKRVFPLCGVLLSLIFGLFSVFFSIGCGTAKLTNTSRTGTEQLLLSDAMDRAVSQVNFSMLSGKKIFINSTAISSITDSAYLLSLIRQHALASGCLLQEKEEDADIILEIRAGTSGTDQHDFMFGISEMTIPGFGSLSATTIPEMAVAKKVLQKATVKIGIFAYTREGRRPVWQSGNLVAESKAKNRWLFGMGPYQTGDIYQEGQINDTNISIPLIDTEAKEPEFVSVGNQAFFRQNLEAEAKEKAEAEAKAKEEAEAKEKTEAEPSEKSAPSTKPEAIPTLANADAPNGSANANAETHSAASTVANAQLNAPEINALNPPPISR